MPLPLFRSLKVSLQDDHQPDQPQAQQPLNQLSGMDVPAESSLPSMQAAAYSWVATPSPMASQHQVATLPSVPIGADGHIPQHYESPVAVPPVHTVPATPAKANVPKKKAVRPGPLPDGHNPRVTKAPGKNSVGPKAAGAKGKQVKTSKVSAEGTTGPVKKKKAPAKATSAHPVPHEPAFVVDGSAPRSLPQEPVPRVQPASSSIHFQGEHPPGLGTTNRAVDRKPVPVIAAAPEAAPEETAVVPVQHTTKKTGFGFRLGEGMHKMGDKWHEWEEHEKKRVHDWETKRGKTVGESLHLTGQRAWQMPPSQTAVMQPSADVRSVAHQESYSSSSSSTSATTNIAVYNPPPVDPNQSAKQGSSPPVVTAVNTPLAQTRAAVPVWHTPAPAQHVAAQQSPAVVPLYQETYYQAAPAQFGLSPSPQASLTLTPQSRGIGPAAGPAVSSTPQPRPPNPAGKAKKSTKSTTTRAGPAVPITGTVPTTGQKPRLARKAVPAAGKKPPKPAPAKPAPGAHAKTGGPAQETHSITPSHGQTTEHGPKQPMPGPGPAKGPTKPQPEPHQAPIDHRAQASKPHRAPNAPNAPSNSPSKASPTSAAVHGTQHPGPRPQHAGAGPLPQHADPRPQNPSPTPQRPSAGPQHPGVGPQHPGPRTSGGPHAPPVHQSPAYAPAHQSPAHAVPSHASSGTRAMSGDGGPAYSSAHGPAQKTARGSLAYDPTKASAYGSQVYGPNQGPTQDLAQYPAYDPAYDVATSRAIAVSQSEEPSYDWMAGYAQSTEVYPGYGQEDVDEERNWVDEEDENGSEGDAASGVEEDRNSEDSGGEDAGDTAGYDEYGNYVGEGGEFDSEGEADDDDKEWDSDNGEDEDAGSGHDDEEEGQDGSDDDGEVQAREGWRADGSGEAGGEYGAEEEGQDGEDVEVGFVDSFSFEEQEVRQYAEFGDEGGDVEEGREGQDGVSDDGYVEGGVEFEESEDEEAGNEEDEEAGDEEEEEEEGAEYEDGDLDASEEGDEDSGGEPDYEGEEEEAVEDDDPEEDEGQEAEEDGVDEDQDDGEEDGQEDDDAQEDDDDQDEGQVAEEDDDDDVDETTAYQAGYH